MKKDDKILQWCMDRVSLPHTDTYTERGNRVDHIIKYENGDEFQHIEVYKNWCEKYVQTIINGETVYSANLKLRDFGWREVTA